MTDRDRKLLAIFMVLIVFGGYWFLVLGKKRSAVKEAEKAKQDAAQQLEQAKTAEVQGKAEKKHYPVSYSRVLRMGKAIPVDSDFASLLVQVNDISAAADVAFLSLSATPGATSAPGGASSSTTVCDASGSAGASGASGSAAPPSGAAGASPAAGTAPPAAPAGPSPAQTWVGTDINKAKAGVQTASGDANRAASSSADVQAKCSSAPTLTDLSALASGLRMFTYSFNFSGSFYNLYKVYDGLLNMVKVDNGHVKVTGRLLQINNIQMTVETFPDLTATVDMTGYALPVGSTITAGATPTGPAASNSLTDATVTTDQPADAGTPSATILGGK